MRTPRVLYMWRLLRWLVLATAVPRADSRTRRPYLFLYCIQSSPFSSVSRLVIESRRRRSGSSCIQAWDQCSSSVDQHRRAKTTPRPTQRILRRSNASELSLRMPHRRSMAVSWAETETARSPSPVIDLIEKIFSPLCAHVLIERCRPQLRSCMHRKRFVFAGTPGRLRRLCD